MSSTSSIEKNRKPRIWVDGCFDFMHFGHANALRQAKALFGGINDSYLIAGVHSDEEIQKFKGPTVMNNKERYAAVRACKWVDQVVEDVPYVTDLNMLKEYDIDYCVHGDDMSFDENGNDSYAAIKTAGLMKIVKRTEGVSTTDIVNRLLNLAKTIQMDSTQDWDKLISINKSIEEQQEGKVSNAKEKEMVTESIKKSPYTKTRQYLPCMSKMKLFADNVNEPKEGAKIVYVDGAFDLFHVGHMEFLRRAKEQGDHLIVGLHQDSTINKHKGYSFPIMNIHERVLSVLSCRYVDDVIIGAPWMITEDVLSFLNVDVVVRGSVRDPEYENTDPYTIPNDLNILKTVDSPMPDITTTNIVKRIITNYLKYENRNKKKEDKEVKNIQKTV